MDLKVILDTQKFDIFSQLIPAPSSNLRISHLDHTLETGETNAQWRKAKCKREHGVGTVETNASIPRIFRRHATLPCATLAPLQTFPKSPKLHKRIHIIHFTTALREYNALCTTFTLYIHKCRHSFPLIAKSRGEAGAN